MKVGFLQFNPLFGKKTQNFKKVEKLLENTSADIIVLPELFNTGYTFLNKKELSEQAELANAGDTYDFILSSARRMNCCFAYGFAEKDGNRFYDSSALVSPDGLIGVYRKVHLYFEEKKFFQPGEAGFQIFKYKNIRLGMLICFDWIYPEAVRTLALKKAQVVLHPANLITPYCPEAMITRALENRVFIVLADRIGEERRNGKNYTFIGKSEIVSPNGDILVRAGDEECVKICDINPDIALNKKFNELNDLFEDRRDNLYFK